MQMHSAACCHRANAFRTEQPVRYDHQLPLKMPFKSSDRDKELLRSLEFGTWTSPACRQSRPINLLLQPSQPPSTAEPIIGLIRLGQPRHSIRLGSNFYVSHELKILNQRVESFFLCWPSRGNSFPGRLVRFNSPEFARYRYRYRLPEWYFNETPCWSFLETIKGRETRPKQTTLYCHDI